MDTRPKWQEELINFKGIKSTFIIEGNISDDYPFFSTDQEGKVNIEFCSLNEAIANIFNSEETSGSYEFQYYDPIFGLSNSGYSHPTSYNKKAENLNEIVKNSESIRTSMIVRKTDQQEAKPIVNIVNFASRYINSPDNMSPT